MILLPSYFFELLGSILKLKPLTQNICTHKSNNCTYLFYSFPSCDLNYQHFLSHVSQTDKIFVRFRL